jgi:hypothetical protein
VAHALLGGALAEVGDFENGIRHAREAVRADEAVTLARDRGGHGGEAWALWRLGEIASPRAPGMTGPAAERYQQALAAERGMRPLMATVTSGWHAPPERRITSFGGRRCTARCR